MKGVVLVGETGVGKSRLIEAFFKKSSSYEIYYNVNSIQEWLQAASQNPQKKHVLFLDESNLQDSNLTNFSNLLDDKIKPENKKILHQGKVLSIPENCQILFACNPQTYAGGRVNQALFSRYSIPSIEFCDFPQDYIFHVILKPLIEHVSDADSMVCNALIQSFVDKKTGFTTVRALQHQVMKKVLAYTQKKHETSNLSDFDSKYVLTPTSKPIHKNLSDFLSIKKIQSSQPSLTRMGLHGLLIEGESSCGKSALVVHTLNQLYGIQLDSTPVENRAWIKVDASLSLPKLESVLIEAFERGQAVWIDEINSVSSSGIERVLNSLLCGLHPTTGQVAENPGFCVVATANSAALEGRDILSPALQGRFDTIKHPNLTMRDTKAILDMLIDDDSLKETVAQLMSYFPDEISFRDIISKLPQLVEQFGSSATDNTGLTS